jgi:hypothetical protein
LSEPLYPLVVTWLTQDPVKGLMLAVSVCIVLWHLLDDGGWNPSAEEASDSDGD